MVNYKINVYLKHTEMENMYVREFIELVTQDINGNNFEFTVYEDDNVYDLTNKRVTMVVKSDSGTVIQENCQVVDAKQGKATITLPPDMLIENGPYMAEVQIWEGVNSRVTTLPFDYTVRLSLENDESIKADPRFSLLQVALQNVNDADGKSKEALKLSKEAKAICDDLVPKANTAAQNAQTALDRAESVVTQEELAQKVTLDGKDTKFDFIKNKVVNGVGSQISTTEKNLSINISTIKRIVYKGSYYNISGIKNLFKFGGIILGIDSSNVPYLTSNETGYKGLGNLVFTNAKEVKVIVEFIDNRTIEVMFFNGANKTVSVVEFNSELSGNTVYLYGRENVSGSCVCSTTGEENEIQHNFSALDNQQSIKELHTTDSTGKTSILKLGSDEDHVEMSTGRTLREEYMGVLKTMGKEFVSADGSPVEVNNGIESRVISAEIKGQTIKNYFNCTKNPYYNGTMFYNAGTGIGYDFASPIDTSKKYAIGFMVIDAEQENTNEKITEGSIQFRLNGFGNLSATFKVGEFKFTPVFTGNASIGNYIIPYQCKVKITNMMLIESNEIDKVKGFFTGLTSTEAIISNTGEQYPIYANEEDKANKKVISLGGLGDTKDTLEILEDGSAIYTHAIPSLKPTSNDSTWVKKWTKDADKGTEFSRFYGRPFSNIPDVNKGICDKLELLDSLSWGSATKKGFAIQGNYCFCVPKSELGTDDVDGFKKWLDNLNCTILRTLGTTETPIVTHIPKELVPTVLTHKTNILEVGGKVKASSFKVTLPVDKLAEIEARLQALESTTVDVVLNK